MAVPTDVWKFSISLSRWLDTSVIPGTLLVVTIVAPAGAYWLGLAQSYVSFLGAMSFGIFVANSVYNKKIARARSIASLHHLTDLDATTLKHLLGFIPPWYVALLFTFFSSFDGPEDDRQRIEFVDSGNRSVAYRPLI